MLEEETLWALREPLRAKGGLRGSGHESAKGG